MVDDNCENCKSLRDRVEYLDFLLDYLYEALGPANDDILNMAEEEWQATHPSE
jgi:hypothetical protein